MAPLRHGVVTPNWQIIPKLSKSIPKVYPREPTAIPAYPRGIGVSERETERARANICRRESVSQGVSQGVRIRHIELLQRRS